MLCCFWDIVRWLVVTAVQTQISTTLTHTHIISTPRPSCQVCEIIFKRLVLSQT